MFSCVFQRDMFPPNPLVSAKPLIHEMWAIRLTLVFVMLILCENCGEFAKKNICTHLVPQRTFTHFALRRCVFHIDVN